MTACRRDQEARGHLSSSRDGFTAHTERWSFLAGHKAAAAADEAHDLTGDEDKADEAGLAAQITPPPNDFAAAHRRSEEMIASVQRTMAWVDDRSRPEAPAATSGAIHKRIESWGVKVSSARYS